MKLFFENGVIHESMQEKTNTYACMAPYMKIESISSQLHRWLKYPTTTIMNLETEQYEFSFFSHMEGFFFLFQKKYMKDYFSIS